MLSAIAALVCVATLTRSVSAKKCVAHTDCPKFLPFCDGSGTCELCRECRVEKMGIDGTCGGCDPKRYPADKPRKPTEPKGPAKKPRKPRDGKGLTREMVMRMIKKQLEEDGETETDEEIEKNVDMVMEMQDAMTDEEIEEEVEQAEKYMEGLYGMDMEEEEEEEEEEGPYDPDSDGVELEAELEREYENAYPADDMDMDMDMDGNEGTFGWNDVPSWEDMQDDVQENWDEFKEYGTQKAQEWGLYGMDGMDEDMEGKYEEQFDPASDENDYPTDSLDVDTDMGPNDGYGASCESHGDCPAILPFCYGDEMGGECAPCEECEYLSDGIDGTCGSCGDGYPTIEDNTDYVPECDSHDDCGGDAPFCYDGQCDVCEACEYCQDGIDGTCGPCGDGYPTMEESCEDARLFSMTKKRYPTIKSEKEDDSPISAEDKKKYRKMIQDQLDAEGDAETPEEMETNIKIVAELAKEDQAKALRMANRFTDRLSDKLGLDDDDIEVKVVDALRKAGRKNREGMTEREIGQKLIEGLGQLADDLTDAYVEKRREKKRDMEDMDDMYE